MAEPLKRRRLIEANLQTMLKSVNDQVNSSQVESSSNTHGFMGTNDFTPTNDNNQHSYEGLSEDNNVSYVSPLSPDSHEGSNSSEDSNKTTTNNNLAELLHHWAINRCLSHEALYDLLLILHPYQPHLPLDPRTLLKMGTEDYGILKNYYYNFFNVISFI